MKGCFDHQTALATGRVRNVLRGGSRVKSWIDGRRIEYVKKRLAYCGTWQNDYHHVGIWNSYNAMKDRSTCTIGIPTNFVKIGFLYIATFALLYAEGARRGREKRDRRALDCILSVLGKSRGSGLISSSSSSFAARILLRWRLGDLAFASNQSFKSSKTRSPLFFLDIARRFLIRFISVVFWRIWAVVYPASFTQSCFV